MRAVLAASIHSAHHGFHRSADKAFTN